MINNTLVSTVSPSVAGTTAYSRLSRFVDLLVTTGLVILISSCNVLGFNALFLYGFFLFNGVMFVIRKRKLDLSLVIIVCLWFLINIIVYWVDGFSIKQTMGSLIRLLISYLALKVLGERFWEFFSEYVLVMIKISLAIYVILLVFPIFIPYLGGVFSTWEYEVIQMRYPESWNMFFFNFLERNASGLQRNSGFMWEPGGFGAIVCFATYIYLLRNKFVLDKRFCIYLAAIISTFSVASYLAFFLVMLAYLLQSPPKHFSKISIVIIMVVGVVFMFQNENFWDKIMGYLTTTTEFGGGINARFGKLEYNRLNTLLINLELMLEYPLGYGDYSVLYNGEEFVGVSGIGDIARQWGVIGLVGSLILLYSFFGLRLFPEVERGQLKPWPRLVMFGAFLLLFCSNSIEKNPLFLCMILTPMISGGLAGVPEQADKPLFGSGKMIFGGLDREPEKVAESESSPGKMQQ